MINPVFRREVRTVLRTWKTFSATTAYILCLVAVTAMALLAILSNIMYSGFSPQSSTTMYTLMAGFQLGLIALIVPALTGGAISGERERQTFDLMLVTKMSTFSIVAGKLASSLLVVVLMILAALPVFGIVLYYGAVSLVNLLTMSLYILVVAAMAGSIAIFFSALFKRTVVAIINTYLVLVLMSFGTIFAAIIFNQLAASLWNFAAPPVLGIYTLMFVNPIFGFISVTDSQLGNFTVGSFIESMTNRYSYGAASTPVTITLPLWVANVCFNLVVIVVLLALTSYVIRPAKKSKMYK